jgi:DnaJ-class molecular chaperone
MQKGQNKNYFTSEFQVDRILNGNFVNPYDVLDVEGSATDVEIKKKFR